MMRTQERSEALARYREERKQERRIARDRVCGRDSLFTADHR
jgi:hypothetical protein